jgi:hypothetical protein
VARTSKRSLGLKKYNKILSLLRGKKPISLKEFRKLQKKASGLYPNFKDTPLSKITKKKVKSAKVVRKKPKKVEKKPKLPTIQQIFQTDPSWFEPQPYFLLGEHLRDFGKKYPYIPIQVIWGDKKEPNQFDIQGEFEAYQGSPFQHGEEDMRVYYEIDLGLESTSDFPDFFLHPAVDKPYGKLFAIASGNQFAVAEKVDDWKKYVKKPKKVKVPEDIETIIVGKKPEFTKGKKKKKVDLPKGKEKLPKGKEKDKEKPKSTEGELAIKRAIISDLRQDKKDLTQLFREKLLTKKEYFAELKVINEQISDITKQLKRGGKI